MTTKTEMRQTKVTGEWAADVEYDAFVIDGENWNGFAMPYFSKEETVIVANDQNLRNRQNPEDYCERFEWDGETLVHFDNREMVSRINPNDDGLYYLGDFGWTWTEVS